MLREQALDLIDFDDPLLKLDKKIRIELPTMARIKNCILTLSAIATSTRDCKIVLVQIQFT